MTRIKKIETTLQNAFTNCECKIIDNSHLHAGHAGAQDGKGHFMLMIKADELHGKPRIVQHRLVYQALAELMQTDIHALEIKPLLN
jgi:BolA protein